MFGDLEPEIADAPGRNPDEGDAAVGAQPFESRDGKFENTCCFRFGISAVRINPAGFGKAEYLRFNGIGHWLLFRFKTD